MSAPDSAIILKTITHAVVTTIMCDDDSIYALERGQLDVFLTGDRVEVRESFDGTVTLRREHATAWCRAVRLR